MLGFTWLNYQPGKPGIVVRCSVVGGLAASDAYYAATPPSKTTRLCCLDRTPFMLLPLINIFSLPPEAAQQQPRFFAFPLRCASAAPQINTRLDVSI